MDGPKKRTTKRKTGSSKTGFSHMDILFLQFKTHKGSFLFLTNLIWLFRLFKARGYLKSVSPADAKIQIRSFKKRHLLASKPTPLARDPTQAVFPFPSPNMSSHSKYKTPTANGEPQHKNWVKKETSTITQPHPPSGDFWNTILQDQLTSSKVC